MITENINTAINTLWPMLTVFLVVVIILRFTYLRTNGKEFILYKEVLFLVFIFYLLLFFELTRTVARIGDNNFIPFINIFSHSLGSETFLNNVLGNIFVFIPFGYFAASYIKSKSVGQMFLITFIVSLTVQVIGWRSGGAFDIDSVILNIVGGILGFLLFVGLSAIKKHLPGFFGKDIFFNILTIALIVLLILSYFGIFGFGW